MRPIKQISPGLVQFIAAGEKINDIETAIRELVENSVDAGSRNIEVRLARFGIDSIEVVDDGFGVDEKDFQTLGVRYHTSKITDYNKFQESLTTFGFRGEALSCLINIANVTITTKTKSNPTGSKLTFTTDGSWKIEPVARSKGTTVILKNLFHSLPVRRRELEMTAKRQYDKVVKLMYEQVLARPYIRFTLCKKNVAKKEKDFTHGGTTLEGCIVTIFGIKMLDSLMPIKQPWVRGLAPQQTVDQSHIKDDNEMKEHIESVPALDESTEFSEEKSKQIEFEKTTVPVREEFFRNKRKSIFKREKPEYLIHGYISKIGCGRNSTDCQFMFVNKKPCDISQVSRLINETYRSYSPSQYPFYCLFIQVQAWAADFNVPRKRAVILQEENKLYSTVKEALDTMYSPLVQSNHKSCPIAQIPVASQVKSNGNLSCSNNSAKKRVLEKERDDEAGVTPSKKQVIQEVEKTKSTYVPQVVDHVMCNQEVHNQEVTHQEVSSQLSSDQGVSEKTTETEPSNDIVDATADTCQAIQSSNSDKSTLDTSAQAASLETDASSDIELDDLEKGSKYFDGADTDHCKTSKKNISVESHTPGFQLAIDILNDKSYNDSSTSMELCCVPVRAECRFQQYKATSRNGRLQVMVEHMEDLSLALERERQQRKTEADNKEYSYSIHPNFNVVAEEELKLNLDKTSFEAMKVIGQFNKGFIITRLKKHLFIIDQHATDERANFENHLEKYPLIKQPMVVPKPLYLNSIQENIVINNIDAFKQRGFEFVIDQSKVAGFRVKLASTSICKGQGLDDQYLSKEDVEELIDVIISSPNNLSSYTLKKVRYVAASRACRGSVMIGDRLTHNQMCDIVSKMQNLQNPWVCAHNRPTIRHLMDTDWMINK